MPSYIALFKVIPKTLKVQPNGEITFGLSYRMFTIAAADKLDAELAIWSKEIKDNQGVWPEVIDVQELDSEAIELLATHARSPGNVVSSPVFQSSYEPK